MLDFMDIEIGYSYILLWMDSSWLYELLPFYEWINRPRRITSQNEQIIPLPESAIEAGVPCRVAL